MLAQRPVGEAGNADGATIVLTRANLEPFAVHFGQKPASKTTHNTTCGMGGGHASDLGRHMCAACF